MENKKKLIIEVMKKLLPYWPMAEGIIALIESKYIDKKAIDWLLVIISEAIKTTKWDKERSKLQRAVEAVQKIKHKEDIDKEEADKLLESI